MPKGSIISIEEKIKKAETALAKAKSKYDAEAAVLKGLLQKKQAMQDKEILDAVARSKQSFEDILNFINSKPNTE